MGSHVSEQEEKESSFWGRDIIGIPYWLCAIVILILIVFVVSKTKFWRKYCGNNESEFTFSKREFFDIPEVTPVELRLGLPTN